MSEHAQALPIDAVLPELTGALRAHNAAVVVAPPGAGKTTRVPLVLADEAWAAGKKILVLAPRRLAARAAAARMAATWGEAVGATVGYRVRFAAKVSRATRIEVVTEGVFTRLVLDDPALTGIAQDYKYDGSRDGWKAAARSQFSDGPIGTDDGLRRVIEMVVAAVVQ